VSLRSCLQLMSFAAARFVAGGAIEGHYAPGSVI
jgi:hypothetical protein